MKRIPLSRGKFALVDNEAYAWLIQHKWHVIINGYAVTGKQVNKIRKRFLMHRLIINAPMGLEVDHINGDKLDNRRCNLRLCTTSQNHMNIGKFFGKSKYKGSHWHKNAKKWLGSIKINGKQTHLGTFDTEIDAAKAYNKAALKYHGKFAQLNVIV